MQLKQMYHKIRKNTVLFHCTTDKASILYENSKYNKDNFFSS